MRLWPTRSQLVPQSNASRPGPNSLHSVPLGPRSAPSQIHSKRIGPRSAPTRSQAKFTRSRIGPIPAATRPPTQSQSHPGSAQNLSHRKCTRAARSSTWSQAKCIPSQVGPNSVPIGLKCTTKSQLGPKPNAQAKFASNELLSSPFCITSNTQEQLPNQAQRLALP
jgi:hypothetical protein